VGFQLQSLSILEITTANEDATPPRVTRALAVY
jgi:hypothetical protein